MKASDLEIDELLHVSDGQISLQGRRMVLHSMHAFGRLRKDLFATLGWSQTRRLFTRFGYFWGQIDADTLTNSMQWPTESERLRAMARMISLAGLADATILKLEIGQDPRSFHMECIWDKSGEVSEFLDEVGPTDMEVCWKLIGYASGFASYCFGEPVYFIEHNCRAKGDVLCTAITPHLPFFHSDDISGRVEQLGKQMRSKPKRIRPTISRSEKRNENTPFFSEGRSDSFYQVLDLSDRVAQFDSSVLITGGTGANGPSWRWTAGRFRKRCWKRNYSATAPDHSPAQFAIASDCLRKRAAVRCFLTRSATSVWPYRPNYSA